MGLVPAIAAWSGTVVSCLDVADGSPGSATIDYHDIAAGYGALCKLRLSAPVLAPVALGWNRDWMVSRQRTGHARPGEIRVCADAARTTVGSSYSPGLMAVGRNRRTGKVASGTSTCVMSVGLACGLHRLGCAAGKSPAYRRY